MTDIIVCDKEKEHMNLLREMCFRYLFEKNADAQVYGYDSVELARQKLNASHIKMTCMMECGAVIENLIGDIRDSNSDDFIVLLSDSMQTLIRYTTPKIRPAGCLLKPVGKTELRTIMEFIEEELRQTKETGAFHFKIKSKEYVIRHDHIVCFEASNKKMIVYTLTQEFEFYDTMDSVLKGLPDNFLRTHKSFIVNMDYVEEADYKEMTLSLKGGLIVDISRTYKAQVIQNMNGDGD